MPQPAPPLPEPDPPALAVEAVVVERLGAAVFAPVSFTLHAGEVLCLEGANGAGKSTLLRALAGLVPIAEGRVSWFGRELPAPDALARARIGFLGHQLALRAELSALDNLRFLATLDGVAPAAVSSSLFERIGLGGYEEQPAGRLSAGQRKRLALARLWLPSRCTLWLLDEPFANLDRAGQTLVAELIQHLRQHAAVVHSSHGLLGHVSAEQRLTLHAPETSCA
ncbi:MAG: heme ABC exporter ATP-binding protein CcmA [Xanthomonadales bacterium]|jgi:heme exporter protein A|nr:heme ABC exporter ATP-binding protein CcmA [Xanthomonadales bacterium]